MNHAPPVQKQLSRAKAGPLRPPAGPLVARHPEPVSPMLGRGACACGGTCPRCLSRSSLSIGPADDPLEREADAMADRIMGLPGRPLAATAILARPARQRNSVACEAAGDGLDIQAKSESDSQSGDPAPVDVERVLAKPGHPLDDASRAYYEPRLGRDLSDVRVHTDADAARSARQVGALAYTVGADVVFAAGRYAPRQPVGRRLLAHELAHVLQQRQSGPVLQRQTGAAATPAFSVARADYAQLLNRALSSLTGRLLAGTTLASIVHPMLTAMAAQVVWRDEHGAEHGGGVVSQTVPGAAGGATVSLRMVLDDVLDPPQAGQFVSSGSQGAVVVKIRANDSVEALTEVLYHESLHMLSWLINDHGGRVTGIHDRWAVRGLDMSSYTTQIAAIRRNLELLAGSANAGRRAGGRAEIAAGQLDSMASWLMEEVQVRAETQVFQLASQVQSQRGQRGAVYLPTRQYGEINADMVDRYVFEFSRVFEAADRGGLSAADRDFLRILMETLEGFYQLHVRRRFSLTAHMGIPRAPVDISLPPPRAPSFLHRIEESVLEGPF
jgi:hypothetical protein